jgi:predicted GNAT family acetyltransferase
VPTYAVRDNPDRSRFELFEDDRMVGVADYRVNGATMVLPHTEIEPARRGRGLGDRIVKHALDAARAAGQSVVPSCWFVAEYIDLHPEYADLLVGADARS